MANLSGPGAINKLREGKDAWNEWVELNPEGSISFDNIGWFNVFNQQSHQPKPVFSFEGYLIPENGLFFKSVQFNDGSLIFQKNKILSQIVFTQCNIYSAQLMFDNCNFKDAELCFSTSEFRGSQIEIVGGSCTRSKFNFDAEYDVSSIVIENLKRSSVDISICIPKFDRSKCTVQKNMFSTATINLSATKFTEGLEFNDNQFKSSDIDLSSTIFTKGISFERNRLGTGNVDCSNSKFKSSTKSIASFAETRLSEGEFKFNNVEAEQTEFIFDGCVFGDCKIDFDSISLSNSDFRFQKCELEAGKFRMNGFIMDSQLLGFADSRFGKASVSFRKLTSSADLIDFANCRFEGDKLSFSKSKFSGQTFHFVDVICLSERLDFSLCTLPAYTRFCRSKLGGITHFKNSTFGVENEGVLDFNSASFSDNKVDFDDSSFMSRFTSFDNVDIANASVHFQNCSFHGYTHFQNLVGVTQSDTFTFRGSVFERSLVLSSDDIFGCVVDLTQTKLGNQVLLDGVQCSFSYQERAHFWSASKAKDKHDSARFRRLKEIAQDNRNHRQSINFNIGEMQTRRWYDSSHSENVLEWFFRTTSDYGRSFVLPLLWLALSFLMFAAIYCIAATGSFSSIWQKIAASMAFSFGQAFPFIPVSRTARMNGELVLFSNNISETIIGVAALQGVISVLLLFLFGLALRNQFRV